jgi:ubiquinone/menaquinone biosynthesis C-methylase UbiE
MNVRPRVYAGIARQLGHPAGLVGRLVGLGLNLGNRQHVSAAVDALPNPPGAVVADIGFGGGIGLELLLDRLDAGGKVHGVEVSSEMLHRAARRFRAELAAGQLELHRGTLTDLPLGAASLDGLITTNTIYFVADLERAFGELATVLKPSGCAVIGIGDPEAMRKLPMAAHGFHIRPVGELVEALESAGLALAEQRAIGSGSTGFLLLVAGRRAA